MGRRNPDHHFSPQVNTHDLRPCPALWRASHSAHPAATLLKHWQSLWHWEMPHWESGQAAPVNLGSVYPPLLPSTHSALRGLQTKKTLSCL